MYNEINRHIIERQSLIKANITRGFGQADPNRIEKAEGSRGGHILGHTKSGKPIYDKFEHKEHKDFTTQDHRDSALKHSEQAAFYKEGSVKAKHHEEQHDKHAAQVGDKGLFPIGKTKSGKAVYNKASDEAHKDFTYKDHEDAEKIHREKQHESLKKQFDSEKKYIGGKENIKSEKHHGKQAVSHSAEAYKKGKPIDESVPKTPKDAVDRENIKDKKPKIKFYSNGKEVDSIPQAKRSEE